MIDENGYEFETNTVLEFIQNDAKLLLNKPINFHKDKHRTLFRTLTPEYKRNTVTPL